MLGVSIRSSSTLTAVPPSASSHASINPVGPAPTTTTSEVSTKRDASRSVRLAVLVEPICELAAAADRAKPALGGFAGFRGGDDEQLVAGPDVGVGLRDE